MNIPELPIQLVAVTETVKNGVSPQQVSELSQILVAEGSNLSDQLSAHFVTSEVNQKKSNFYNSFFREVCDKKAEIEKAFSLDEHLSGRLDDSVQAKMFRKRRYVLLCVFVLAKQIRHAFLLQLRPESRFQLGWNFEFHFFISASS